MIFGSWSYAVTESEFRPRDKSWLLTGVSTFKYLKVIDKFDVMYLEALFFKELITSFYNYLENSHFLNGANN